MRHEAYGAETAARITSNETKKRVSRYKVKKRFQSGEIDGYEEAETGWFLLSKKGLQQLIELERGEAA